LYASWAPDRLGIVYQKYIETWESVEICIIDTALTSEIRLTNDHKDDRYPQWSPDGKMIAWSSNVRIMVMNIDGIDKKVLDYGQYPSWSPGSDYIIYSNANQDVTKEVIWRIDIDGNNKTQLTF
jgi:Tol biopolymer transport system component